MDGTKKFSYTKIMDELFSDFKCSICLEVFIDATMTNCQHIHCRFCINKWLQFSPKCPQCLSTISKCTQVKNIDDQIDEMYKSLPPSILEDREETKRKRRKLEENDSGSIQPANFIDKLRAERTTNRIILNPTEETWLEKLSPYIKKVYPSLSSSSSTCCATEERSEKDKLPRLVAMEKSDEVEKKEDSNNNNNNENIKYENLKLPPIKMKKSRQVRGINTASTPAPAQHQQQAEDFPKGMEGDIIQPDTRGAEDSIRELERRNQYLEDQLFGAYDRIIDTIKDQNKEVAKTVHPNAFSNNTKNGIIGKSNHNSTRIGSPHQQEQHQQQLPQFNNKESTNPFLPSDDPTNSIHDVDDLLAETEDLMEIEEFLKQFPFERIRDDEELIGYNSDDNNADINLDLLDSDHIEDISAHRALKPQKKLTKDQEIIENFYKKLESKRINSTTSLSTGINSSMNLGKTLAQGQESVPNNNKTVHTPVLNKFGNTANIATIPKMPSNSQVNVSGQSPKIASRACSSSTHNNNNNSNSTTLTSKNTTKLNIQHVTKPLLPKLINKNANTHTTTTIGCTQKLTAADTSGDICTNNIKDKNKPKEQTDDSSGSGANKPKNITQEQNLESALGLDYDDFLKLEIDFLDGDGDWTQFGKNMSTKNGNTRKKKKLIPMLPAKEVVIRKSANNVSFQNTRRGLSTVSRNLNNQNVKSESESKDKTEMTTAAQKKNSTECIINRKKVASSNTSQQQHAFKQNPGPTLFK